MKKNHRFPVASRAGATAAWFCSLLVGVVVVLLATPATGFAPQQMATFPDQKHHHTANHANNNAKPSKASLPQETIKPKAQQMGTTGPNHLQNSNKQAVGRGRAATVSSFALNLGGTEVFDAATAVANEEVFAAAVVGGFSLLGAVVIGLTSLGEDDKKQDEEPDITVLSAQLKQAVEAEKGQPVEDRVKKFWVERERMNPTDPPTVAPSTSAVAELLQDRQAAAEAAIADPPRAATTQQQQQQQYEFAPPPDTSQLPPAIAAAMLGAQAPPAAPPAPYYPYTDPPPPVPTMAPPAAVTTPMAPAIQAVLQAPPPPPAAVAPPAPTPMPEVARTYSSFAPGQGRAARTGGGRKQSYAMNSWSPKTQQQQSGTVGSSGSYLANMTGGGGSAPQQQPMAAAASASPPYSPVLVGPPAPPVSAPPPASSSHIGSAKKSYAMSSWSPNKPVGNAATAGSSGSYLSNMGASQPAIAPTEYSPPAPVSSPPAAASQAVGGGSGSAKKSYAMSSWSPNKPVGNSATAGSSGSYLSNMGASQPAVVPEASSAPAPVPVSAPPAVSSAVGVGGGGGGAKKKSYAMSSWSPNKPAGNAATAGSSGSYLSNMGASQPAVAPAEYSPLAPVQVSSPPAVASQAVGGGGGGAKKSYAMSSWSPNKPVGNAATAGSSGSYLSNMSATQPAVVPSAPTPVPVSSSQAVSSQAAKKSYAMSSWSPNKPVGNAATAGSSASYLSNMGASQPAVVPAAYSAPAPVTPVSTPPAPEPSYPFTSTTSAPVPSGDYMSGLGSVSNMKESYAPSKWSPRTGGTKVAPAATGGYLGSVTSPPADTPQTYTTAPTMAPSRGAKKSYAMNSWNPYKSVKATTGSSGSYLAKMSDRPAPAVAPARPVNTAAYSPTPPLPAAKKSYSMTSWSPDKAVGNAATAGNSGSYLSNMGTSQPSDLPVYSPAPAEYAPTSSPPAVSNGSGAKKSYSMTSWSPDKAVGNAATAGSSGSYLAGMDSAQQSSPTDLLAPIEYAPAAMDENTAQPPIAPAYSPAPESSSPAPVSPPASAFVSNADYMTGLSGDGIGLPKKSYSMSDWAPGDRVNHAATAGSSTAYLTNMNAPPLTGAPEYPMAAVSSAPSSEFGLGEAKKSYSTTSWSPNKQTAESSASYPGVASGEVTSGANGDNTNGDHTHEAPPSAPVSTLPDPSGFSASSTKWSPDNPRGGVMAGSGNYLSGI